MLSMQYNANAILQMLEIKLFKKFLPESRTMIAMLELF